MNFLARLEWKLSQAFGKPKGNLIYLFLRNFGIYIIVTVGTSILIDLDSKAFQIGIAASLVMALVTAIPINRVVYSRFVGVEKIHLLSVGQKVIYRAGLGDLYILAEATVTSTPEMNSCYIRIDQIIRHGENTNEHVGEKYVATGDELFFA